jgi:ceramide glucosyltransferase
VTTAAASLSWILVAAAAVGTVYQVVSTLLLRRFAARPAAAPATCPPVTLLKPLCGDEPRLEANLRSFCCQRYPATQIVFGVHSADDPARLVAERIRADGGDVAVVVGRGDPETGNPKVANLVDMMPVARHDVLVVSDSDMEVGPDYVAAVVATLERPGIGIATCLYVGSPAEGVWSRLGAMGINHGFLPSVLVAEAVGRTDGCFGATIAIRRDTLAAVGGFESLREQLADDYLLGAAVRARGQTIALAQCLPRSVVYEPGFVRLFAHELRWGRTLASIDPFGYFASVVTQAVPLALLGLAAAVWAGSALPAAVAALAAVAGRLWAVRGQERALGLERQPVWLVMLRDVLSFAVQMVAVSGRTVRWRGRRFRIGRQGILVPFEESPRA